MDRIINRELVSVIAIVSLAVLAMSVLQPVLPLYLTSIGINPGVLGLMFSLSMVGMVFGESSGGWLADRIGMKVPMGIGTVACVPVVLGFVFARGAAAIFMLFFLWGIVRATVFGPGRGFIGATVPLSHRGTLMAAYAAAMAVSRSLGAFLGGVVADVGGYHWCFYTSAMIGVVGGALVIFVLKPPGRMEPRLIGIAVRPAGGHVPRSYYDARSFFPQCAVGALNFAALGVIAPFLPLLAVARSQVGATEVGVLMMAGALVNAVLLVPMGRLSDRWNKKGMMAGGLLVSAGGMVGLSLVGNYAGLVTATVALNIGGAMFAPAAVSLLSETVPARWQNTAMGVYGASEDIGVVIGSALGGVVWSTLGPSATFLITGMVPVLLGALVTLVLIKGRVVAAVD